MKLLLGDCLDKLKELEDNSVDSIVTDPPYGLAFMGKKWDYDVPSQQIWEECMRVLKPGGHLLAFAGSRTYHRMAVRIEDAGFEIRDQIMWIYGSGFPKSHNISKAINKIDGVEFDSKPADGVGFMNENGEGGYNITKNQLIQKGESSERAKEWEGWGTALKPAHEPIVMARKPLSEKTVVDNVLEWGTGGINIDESRIAYQSDDDFNNAKGGDVGSINCNIFSANGKKQSEKINRDGRFPANIIFDEEAGKLLDEQSGLNRGQQRVVKGDEPSHSKKNAIYGDYSMVPGKYMEPKDALGGASRFFYCPKTSKGDRNEGLDEFETKKSSSMPGRRNAEDMSSSKIDNDVTGRFVTERKNTHPTVKPTDLMLYLIRLVTPKGGTTLDPFMGSGSTGKAAVRGGFDFIGIEREKEYFEIAEARIGYEMNNPYVQVKSKRVEINKNSNKFF